MHVHYGIYHFAAKRTAFRNDFCVRCDAERLAIHTTTLDVLHVYWVPLVPIGRIGRWHCLNCGHPVDRVRTSRRSIKVLLAIVLAIVALMLWLEAAEAGDTSRVMSLWTIRLVVTLALLATIRWIAIGSDDVVRRAHLETIGPCRLVTCPACSVNLRPGSSWRCPQCDMVRQ